MREKLISDSIFIFVLFSMFNQLRKAAQEAKNKLVDAVDEQNSGQFECPICHKRFANPEILIQAWMNIIMQEEIWLKYFYGEVKRPKNRINIEYS